MPEARRVNSARLDRHPGAWRYRIDVCQAGRSGKAPFGGLNYLKCFAVWPGGHVGDRQQCFVFAGEDEAVPIQGEVQRSVADSIPDQQDSAAVVDGAGELARNLLKSLESETRGYLQQKSGIVIRGTGLNAWGD